MICILSLVYRKKKVPEHPTWKVVYSETMVKNHDYYIRLHTGPQGGYWCFLLRAVRTPIYAREFDTLKSKKVPQSLEIGLFFCQIFIFII